MELQTIMIMGVAVFINVAFILFKVKKKRYSDAALDTALLVGMSMLFKGTVTGLMVGTIASALVSIYLWFSPPTYIDDIVKKIEDNAGLE